MINNKANSEMQETFRPVAEASHSHSHSRFASGAGRNKGKLKLVLALSVAILVIELIGSWAANSLTLFAEARPL
jgi:Co/Zn/Cd efflux system component